MPRCESRALIADVSDYASGFLEPELKARINAVAMQIRRPTMPATVAICWVMPILQEPQTFIRFHDLLRPNFLLYGFTAYLANWRLWGSNSVGGTSAMVAQAATAARKIYVGL